MQGLRSNEKGLTDTSYAALYIFWKWCCVWCSSQFRLFVTDKFTESICFPRSWLCHLYLRHVPLRFCLSPLEPPVSNILFKSASSVDLFTFKPGFKECTLYPALPTFNSRTWLDCDYCFCLFIVRLRVQLQSSLCVIMALFVHWV